MKIGVPKETAQGERRVALVPDVVKALTDKGIQVVVEAGAGEGASYGDADYKGAGARKGSPWTADVVLKVAAPTPAEVKKLKKGQVLIGFLEPLTNSTLAKSLARKGVASFAMESIPRITRAQSMDALSSQATVAGYKAVLLAAEHLPKFLPMFTTAAGTIRPGKALILGAGVAGLQAIATARRLGAVVEAFDVRPAVKEQVESLGAKFLETEHEVTAEGEGGYAKELSEEQHKRELELIGGAITQADVVITTAQIPGREAPRLVTDEMLASMRPGSVIVDLAAESGGNCEGTKAGELVVRHGVQILGPVNLAATIPVHASQMYSKNVTTLLAEIVGDGGEVRLDFDNDVVGPATVTHGGEVTNERVRASLGAS
jgi:proton-translocating NAD(P)+ transhydrogenase subunit alpha